MKSIGELLKETRIQKRYSVKKIEEKTKIKSSYVKLIESESWESLPEYPVVQGFIRSIASALSIDTQRAVALLKRDYPPKKLSVNPKPDVGNKFFISPRLAFISGVVVVFLAITSYLVYQYINFVSPPPLSIQNPLEDQTVRETNIKVIGATDPDVSVKVNNQSVLVSDDGTFETEIEILQNTTYIEVVAQSRSGKETLIKRNISVQIEN